MLELPTSHGGDFLCSLNSNFWILEINKQGSFYLQDDITGQKTPQYNERNFSPQQIATLFPKRSHILIVADKRLSCRVIGKVFTAMRCVNRYKINLVVNADFS